MDTELPGHSVPQASLKHPGWAGGEGLPVRANEFPG